MNIIPKSILKMIRYLRYRRAYPGVKFSLGSYISPDSELGKGVIIEKGVTVLSCQIGAEVKACGAARLFMSKIGGKAVINFSATVENSTIGNESIIGASSRVCRSEVGNLCVIDSSVTIDDSVLGERMSIRRESSLAKCRLEGVGIINANSTLLEVEMGSHSYCAHNVILAHTKVGRFCSIGPDCIAGYGNHPTNLISTSPFFYSTKNNCGGSFAETDCFQEEQQINIGHDVWIGARVFIKDGIRIGDGAVIGAGAVVVKDVPDYAIVGGVPAKVLRYRFENHDIKMLKAMAWWNWSEIDLKEVQPMVGSSRVDELVLWAKQRFG